MRKIWKLLAAAIRPVLSHAQFYDQPMVSRLPISQLPYLNLLQKCSTMDQLTQIHTQLITTGLSRFTYTTSKVLAFCALHKNGKMGYATTLLTQMETPAIFDFNVMIMGCSKTSPPENGLAFRVYKRMRTNGFEPNARTFPALAKTCSDMSTLCQVNGQIMKLGFSSDVYVVSSLVCMYSGFGSANVARKVFDESSNRNVVCWTSLVSGYCENGLVDEARKVFNSMPERTDVSCSAMISGYVSNKRFNEAIELFTKLKGCATFKSNRSLLVCILNACAAVGRFNEGEWVCSYINENFLELDIELATTLINFYSKCGKINDSEIIFNQMPYKDVTTWSAMILGLALNGKNESALRIFKEMEERGPKPNDVTFIGAISACNHKAFAGESWILFGRMHKVYGIEPAIEHYGCMVDLLARAGRIKQAEVLIKVMKREPDGAIWGSLLNGCFIHGSTELAERVGKILIQLEPQHGGRYILMSNLYASMGCWEGVLKLREMMKEKKVQTLPGWSSVEIDGVVLTFVVDSKTNSHSKDIYMILNQLNTEILNLSQFGEINHCGGINLGGFGSGVVS